MSGFSYPEWICEIYPPGTTQKGMLSAYATIFNAVEINSSFRRTPEEQTIDRWRDAVPPDFRFAIKANGRITHWRRLVDVGDVVAEFVERVRRMGERLGPVLFQVRPNMKFDAGVVNSFGASLPPGTTYAFEPRDPSFMTDEAHEVLRAHGLALCLNDDVFDPKTYATTGAFAYFRFHRTDYTESDLERRAALVTELATQGDVYVFFAHEDNPESVGPALAMKKLLSRD